MTKRFTGEFDKQYSGVHDNGEQLTNFEVVDLLNDLSEDNEYLEKRFKEEEWHYDHIDEDRDVWKYKCQELEKENEQLKAQLYCDSEEGVCSICKHHYLEKGNIFYISKCEKGHEKCSKESVRHCEDFKLKELQIE